MKGYNMKKILILLLALALLCSCGVKKQTKNDTKKVITVTVVSENEQGFRIETERKYLGDVLKDEGLIVGRAGEYGTFITAVDGVVADEKNEEWWCLTKEGESVMTGVDKTEISDGDKFELTLKKGY